MEVAFDLYDDLDVFVEQPQEPSTEVSELNETLRNIKDQLTEANQKNENLLNLNKTLKYNISTILLTARRELARKEERINSLVKEKDAIIFRRTGPKSKPENELIYKTGLCDPGSERKNYKQTCDKSMQTEDVTSPYQKRNKCVQTEKKPDIKKCNESSQTDVSNKHFQIIRYVGEHNIAFKTEHIEVQEFIDKRHQSIQTNKNTETQVAKESIKNSKTVDDSDVIESLLALSRGCANTDPSQKLLNDDYEKLLLDRQTILDELNKADKSDMPVKRIGRPPKKKIGKKKPSRPKEKINSKLDIYELPPTRQMDKSKPIRQYGKQNTKLLQDCNTPIFNNSGVGKHDFENTMEHDIVIKPTLPQAIKKVETINVKHSRKQKFTNIRTNCNLEHIPTEPFEFQRKQANDFKPKPQITRSRKRRLDALFDEAVQESVMKLSSRSQTLTLVEKVEKTPTLPVVETVEIIPDSKPELATLSSNKIDNETLSICSNSKPTPLVDLPLISPFNNDIKWPLNADSQAPPLPPPSLIETPLLRPANDNKIKQLYLDPKPEIASLVELSSLPPNNIENASKAISLEMTTSQDGEEQNGQSNSLNSSVEIKMSTTSYKIETHGDETTVYIRRNKKKKKHLL